MAGNLNEPLGIYEQLWQEAVTAFGRGEPRLDPFLKNRAGDQRWGITLVARPNSKVRSRVEQLLRDMAKVAPGQHFYQPAEFHLTVFSIIPGSEFWRESLPELPGQLAVLDEVLRNRPAFTVAFRGVTASPEAVMIQGFLAGSALAELRDDLRTALSQRGLGKNLDRRYKIMAAHLTVVRFATPMTDWKPLKMLLASHRNTDFGESQIRSLELVESDWYASANTVRLLREYPLL